jgi:outer membrane protein OmpA-like peptidoglycan-associated protein
MDFKNRLLATAAVPVLMLAVFGASADAAMLRGAQDIATRSLVIPAAMSVAEARAQLAAARQALADAKANGGDVKAAKAAVAAARADLDAAQAAGAKPDRNAAQADDAQPAKKRQKNADSASSDASQTESKVITIDPADNGQGDDEIGKKRKKRAEATESQSAGDASNDAPDQPKATRKDNAKGSIEEIVTEPVKKNKAAADPAQDAGNSEGDTPERIKKRKKVADNPAATADTIVLPVENGAAVLDSDKEADKSGDASSREKRRKARAEVKPGDAPKSDRDSQAGFREPVKIEPALKEKGERITGFQGYDRDEGKPVGKKEDLRVIINLNGRVVIRDDDRNRMGRDGDTRYDRLEDGRIREIVTRPDGDRVVTVRNRYGEIIRRSRIDRGGKEIVIFYSPALEKGRERLYLRDPGASLPPMRLTIPVSDYIIDVSSEPDRDYRAFLARPPVEKVERVYSVDEVKYSARIRDKVRRIDLDTITFDTGSAEIAMDQAASLRAVAKAIKDLLAEDPGETFLIEGHTDAVGADEANLILSDERAESVANVLSDLFDIPPENLVTQGYGERYLKVATDGPERMNRRVTIRRITPLVRPVAAAE